MRRASVLLAFALLLSVTPALSRPFRVNDIPNGEKNGCYNCHEDDKGAIRTPFGSEAQNYLEGAGGVQQQHVNWAPLCVFDSDGDGWTNGKELGDPDCTWKLGDPNPKASVFNPGNPLSHPFPVCGNGKLDAAEYCEGDLMSKTDCIEENAGEGKLGCTENCRFDYTECSMPPFGSTSSGGDEFPTPVEEGCSAGGPATPGGGAAALALMLSLAIARSAARRTPRAMATRSASAWIFRRPSVDRRRGRARS